jgi:hypothetical protein
MATTLRPGIGAAALVTLLGASGNARAGVAVQGVLTASAGVTDNVQSAPNDPVPGVVGRQTDLIVTLTPGLTLSAGNARSVFRLQYLFNALVYAKNTDADSYTNNVILNAFFQTTKRTALSLTFNLNEGRQSTFNNVQDSTAAAQVQIVPPAILDLLNFSASETFVSETSKRSRLIESLSFATSYRLGGSDQGTPSTQDVVGRIGVDYNFPRDIVGVDVNFDYAILPALAGPIIAGQGKVDPEGTITPRQDQLTLTPLARWNRDLTYFLSIRANLGAVVLLDPRNTDYVGAEPAGGFGLNIFGRTAQFDASYQHGAATNLLLRAEYLTDTASLRGTFRFGDRSPFTLALGLSYAYSRQLEVDKTVSTIGHSILGDITLGYTPFAFSTFFIRYNIIDQIGRSTDPQPVPSMYRNTLLFGISLIYPPVISLEVPKSAIGVRADGRDGPSLSSSKSTPP